MITNVCPRSLDPFYIVTSTWNGLRLVGRIVTSHYTLNQYYYFYTKKLQKLKNLSHINYGYSIKVFLFLYIKNKPNS